MSKEDCVSLTEFVKFCDEHYPPDGAMKTMRQARIDRIGRYLKGIEAPPLGSWRYRIMTKGYRLMNFTRLNEKEVLCLKGTAKGSRIEQGRYGEYRKVLAVEDFYPVLMEAHVNVQKHGGYKNLFKVVERDYCGVPRDAVQKFVNLCSVCMQNPRQRLMTSKDNPASLSERTVKVPCITRDFNRRCQIDLMDMTPNPDGEFRFICLYMDHWTKFLTLFPMTGCTPDHVASGLVAAVFPFYGPPHFLHSMVGTEYAEQVIRLACDKWRGGEEVILPKARPGLMHLAQTVDEIRDVVIAKINQRAAQDTVQGAIPWGNWLGKIMFEINNTSNQTTGTSAFSRVFEKNFISNPDPDQPLHDYAVKGDRRNLLQAQSKKQTKRKMSETEKATVILRAYKMPKPGGGPFKVPDKFVAIELPTVKQEKMETQVDCKQLLVGRESSQPPMPMPGDRIVITMNTPALNNS